MVNFKIYKCILFISIFALFSCSKKEQVLDSNILFFISAISGTDAAHSWIIDGDTNINGFYYVHCYWGWSGHSNGYFSTSCFQPNNGVVYDNIGNNSIDNSIYSWHFRLLTYNVPNIVRNESLNIPIESL